jgi:hypothetical protein
MSNRLRALVLPRKACEIQPTLVDVLYTPGRIGGPRHVRIQLDGVPVPVFGRGGRPQGKLRLKLRYALAQRLDLALQGGAVHGRFPGHRTRSLAPKQESSLITFLANDRSQEYSTNRHAVVLMMLRSAPSGVAIA